MRLDLPEKRYYSIGEIAKHFDVNTSLLRYWEKEFKEIQPQKKTRGFRKYTPKDIENIELIHHLLKEKGMTIEGAKKQLKVSRNKEENRLIILKKLERVKKELESLRDNL